jgi:hypothetical protein
MKAITLMPGQRFARWTVIKEGARQNAHRTVECRCDCGTIKTIGFQSIRRGESGSRSCGCLQRELQTRHGMWRSTEYRIWAKMKQRCLNPDDPSWHNYGGRGITVCRRWENSFDKFLEDVGLRPSILHSLDRWPNNDDGYKPNNVRWATRAQQRANTRDTVWERIVLLLAGDQAAKIKGMVDKHISDKKVAQHIARCFKQETYAEPEKD